MALSSNGTAENEITKPSAISAGRALPAWPTDAPRRIGSIGSVQGAAMVSQPASRAKNEVEHIRQDPSQSSHLRLAVASELVGSFEAARRGVTRVEFGPRHVFVRLSM